MKYHDSDGKEISIHKLVRLEPDWAASIIPHLNKEIESKDKVIAELRGQLNIAKKSCWSES